MFGWLWRISWQGLDRPGQHEAFQPCRLLSLPSETEPTLIGGGGGRPGHSAITGIVPRDVVGGIEDVGHEAGRFDADSPAELHTLLYTSKNRRREDVLCTLLPGSDGTTRLGLLTEDQPNEDVDTAEGEEEEGGDEGEAVNMMGEDCGSNPVVIQGQIRTPLIKRGQREAGLTSTE